MLQFLRSETAGTTVAPGAAQPKRYAASTVMISNKLKEQVLDAINGYGQVVGLKPTGPGQILGSLTKIEDILPTLAEAAGNENPKIKDLSLAAAAAIRARESINGTSKETANPSAFEQLTVKACDSIKALRDVLNKKAA